MTNTTKSILYSVQDDLKDIRKKMDNYMYGGEKSLDDEDLSYCRKIYDSICRTLDLL